MIFEKTKEELAILADDIADMAQELIDNKDVLLLKAMAGNLANKIRIHDIMYDHPKIGFMAGYDYGFDAGYDYGLNDSAIGRKPWEAWIEWTKSNKK